MIRIKLVFGLPAMFVLLTVSAIGYAVYCRYTRDELVEQIKRFNGPWEIDLPTLRAYWTNGCDEQSRPFPLDSIIAISKSGDDAIPRLVTFIESCETIPPKYAAYLTIELIQNRRIGGRAASSVEARQSFYKLLKNEDLEIVALKLLIRDPLPSDVPYLIERLESGSRNEWMYVKALHCYDLANAPVHQRIPNDIPKITINSQFKGPNSFFFHLFCEIIPAYDGRVVVEDDLFETENVFPNEPFCHDDETWWDIGDIDYISSVRYRSGSLGPKFEYFVENGNIHICGLKVAKNRWLSWYKKYGSNLGGVLLKK